jgi:hypothetical protein
MALAHITGAVLTGQCQEAAAIGEWSLRRTDIAVRNDGGYRFAALLETSKNLLRGLDRAPAVLSVALVRVRSSGALRPARDGFWKFPFSMPQHWRGFPGKNGWRCAPNLGIGDSDRLNRQANRARASAAPWASD